ncbi:MAG: aspartyl beta-hydroxylase [Sphingomonas sp.]|uniref:hypothetical protein n=1 Tax=Sphingomonas sp. TaxID=28214 RepID=UPI0011F4D4DD|nr:hypothetical protein [Sphingomonas sp.]THD34765.1 MAG: aspartyl beta-hydroxylase [Sphingomonas sp.]
MESPPPQKLNDPIHAFMARVLADPAALARLAVPVATNDYVPLAMQIARDYGIALDEADLAALVQPDMLGLGRFAPAPVTLDRWPGEGWVPVRSAPGGAAPAFDWAWFGDATYSGSFFEESVRYATELPFNRMFRTRTSLEALVADAAHHAVTPPSGFVFHMSRCGSTLAARMLMAVPGHLVASEPEPLDAVVHWATVSGAPREDRIAALRAIVAALGRRSGAGQRRFFVKLHAWHTLALPLFRAAFPDVPWLFLYRDPVEVLMSQVTQPGVYMTPGSPPPGVADGDLSAATSPAGHAARVLALMCGAVIDHWGLGGGLAVDYRDLRSAMTGDVPAHFGFRPDASELEKMAAAAGADAKRPSAPFVPDAQDKRSLASGEILAAARNLNALLATLDKLGRDGISDVNDRDSAAR